MFNQEKFTEAIWGYIVTRLIAMNNEQQQWFLTAFKKFETNPPPELEPDIVTVETMINAVRKIADEALLQ